MCERNISWLPLTCPQLGTWPATQACALTGNRTSDLSVCRLALNPLSHTSQGWIVQFFIGALESAISQVVVQPALPCSKFFFMYPLQSPVATLNSAVVT